MFQFTLKDDVAPRPRRRGRAQELYTLLELHGPLRMNDALAAMVQESLDPRSRVAQHGTTLDDVRRVVRSEPYFAEDPAGVVRMASLAEYEASPKRPRTEKRDDVERRRNPPLPAARHGRGDRALSFVIGATFGVGLMTVAGLVFVF